MSFKSAADDLCITPSAVSHQIKALESQLGVVLFERRTRSISLTPTGETLFLQVDPLLRDLERVTSTIAGRVRRRVLRVTLMPFFASELFIPQLGKFSSGSRSIDLRLDSMEIREAGHLATADASILLLSAPPSPELCSYPLFSLRLVPACSPAVADQFGAAGPEALCDSTLIVHKGRPNAWTEWLEGAAVRQRQDARVIYLDSMYAVARAAERGLGIALVPVPLSEGWFRSKALVRLFDKELQTNDCYYFIHRPEDAQDQDILALREWVLRTFASDARNSTVKAD